MKTALLVGVLCLTSLSYNAAHYHHHNSPTKGDQPSLPPVVGGDTPLPGYGPPSGTPGTPPGSTGGNITSAPSAGPTPYVPPPSDANGSVPPPPGSGPPSGPPGTPPTNSNGTLPSGPPGTPPSDTSGSVPPPSGSGPPSGPPGSTGDNITSAPSAGPTPYVPPPSDDNGNVPPPSGSGPPSGPPGTPPTNSNGALPSGPPGTPPSDTSGSVPPPPGSGPPSGPPGTPPGPGDQSPVQPQPENNTTLPAGDSMCAAALCPPAASSYKYTKSQTQCPFQQGGVAGCIDAHDYLTCPTIDGKVVGDVEILHCPEGTFCAPYGIFPSIKVDSCVSYDAQKCPILPGSGGSAGTPPPPSGNENSGSGNPPPSDQNGNKAPQCSSTVTSTTTVEASVCTPAPGDDNGKAHAPYANVTPQVMDHEGTTPPANATGGTPPGLGYQSITSSAGSVTSTVSPTTIPTAN